MKTTVGEKGERIKESSSHSLRNNRAFLFQITENLNIQIQGISLYYIHMLKAKLQAT